MATDFLLDFLLSEIIRRNEIKIQLADCKLLYIGTARLETFRWNDQFPLVFYTTNRIVAENLMSFVGQFLISLTNMTFLDSGIVLCRNLAFLKYLSWL